MFTWIDSLTSSQNELKKPFYVTSSNSKLDNMLGKYTWLLAVRDVNSIVLSYRSARVVVRNAWSFWLLLKNEIKKGYYVEIENSSGSRLDVWALAIVLLLHP